MPLPCVSSEGGPLLIADFEALRSWRGAFHDSGDYTRACEALGSADVAQIQTGAHQAVVWDMGGPGTAHIVQVSPLHLSIVRLWPDAAWSEEEYEQTVISAATQWFSPEERARLRIHSGYLLALWAPEDMSAGGSPAGDSGVPDDLSIGDGGVYVKVPSGEYLVTAIGWLAGNYDVTKLDLTLLP